MAKSVRPRAGSGRDFVNPIFIEVYPNPLDATGHAGMQGRIAFTVPDFDAYEIARIRVYDLLGNIVQTVLEDIRPAGRFTASFDASALHSGLYLAEVRLKHDAQCKMMAVRK